MRYAVYFEGLVKTTTESRAARIKELVGAARAVVTYQVGLPHGATRLVRVGYWLLPQIVPELEAIEQYVQAIRALPIGTERLAWDRAALRKSDIRLEAICIQHRNAVFEACFDIIERYEETRATAASAEQPSANPA